MSVLFLFICAISLLFFTVFLFQCSRAQRKTRKATPTVVKLGTTEAVDSVAGRRTLIHLEQQMAEFMAGHSRGIAALLLAVGLIGVTTQTKAQSIVEPVSEASAAAPTSDGSASDSQIPPAVQQQLDAMQKRIAMLEAELNNRAPQGSLLPPINGATAISGTPYFTENPGDPYKAWDVSATVDYMPSQYVTFRMEYNHRASNVPYFSGPGGITPPAATRAHRARWCQVGRLTCVTARTG